MKAKEIWYDECVTLQRNGQVEEAIAELLKLTTEYPDYPLPHLALAVFYCQIAKFDESMAQMKLACDLEPNDPFYFTAFSALAIKGGKHSEAEEALMKAQEAHLAAQLERLREEYKNENAQENQE